MQAINFRVLSLPLHLMHFSQLQLQTDCQRLQNQRAGRQKPGVLKQKTAINVQNHIQILEHCQGRTRFPIVRAEAYLAVIHPSISQRCVKRERVQAILDIDRKLTCFDVNLISDPS